MKLSFKLIGKIGFLLVLIGFFMPVACDQNGAKIADFFMKNDKAFEGIMMYILLISAIVGIVLGALIAMGKPLSGTIDWVVVIACIAGGLIPYFSVMKNNVNLQTGAYVILVGWIVALGGQVMSKLKTSNEGCLFKRAVRFLL